MMQSPLDQTDTLRNIASFLCFLEFRELRRTSRLQTGIITPSWMVQEFRQHVVAFTSERHVPELVAMLQECSGAALLSGSTMSYLLTGDLNFKPDDIDIFVPPSEIRHLVDWMASLQSTGNSLPPGHNRDRRKRLIYIDSTSSSSYGALTELSDVYQLPTPDECSPFRMALLDFVVVNEPPASAVDEFERAEADEANYLVRHTEATRPFYARGAEAYEWMDVYWRPFNSSLETVCPTNRLPLMYLSGVLHEQMDVYTVEDGQEEYIKREPHWYTDADVDPEVKMSTSVVPTMQEIFSPNTLKLFASREHATKVQIVICLSGEGASTLSFPFASLRNEFDGRSVTIHHADGLRVRSLTPSVRLEAAMTGRAPTRSSDYVMGIDLRRDVIRGAIKLTKKYAARDWRSQDGFSLQDLERKLQLEQKFSRGPR